MVIIDCVFYNPNPSHHLYPVLHPSHRSDHKTCTDFSSNRTLKTVCDWCLMLCARCLGVCAYAFFLSSAFVIPISVTVECDVPLRLNSNRCSRFAYSEWLNEFTSLSMLFDITRGLCCVYMFYDGTNRLHITCMFAIVNIFVICLVWGLGSLSREISDG